MPWIVEIKNMRTSQWEPMRPSKSERYEYETEEEAASMARMCFPDQMREARLGADPVVRVRQDGV
jgi:hypothetical protein